MKSVVSLSLWLPGAWICDSEAASSNYNLASKSTHSTRPDLALSMKKMETKTNEAHVTDENKRKKAVKSH